MVKGLEEDLGKFLYCSSLLEERVAEAYEHIAKLVDDKFVSCLFGYVARDSFKHALCLRLMAEVLSDKVEVCFDECVEIWGETWLTLMKDAENLLSKSEIRPDDIHSLIGGLERLERFAAEEYLTVLHVKIIELMADEKKVNLGYLKMILEWIIEDEEKHRRILKLIEDLLIQSQCHL